MFRLNSYSSRRIVRMAAVLSLPFLAGGCALWDRDNWTLDRYRDERAVEIDQRLSADEPAVKSPF